MRDGTFRGRLVICAVFECLIDDRSTNPTEAAKQPDDFEEIIDNLNSLTRGRPPHPPRPFLPRPKPRGRRGAKRISGIAISEYSSL